MNSNPPAPALDQGCVDLIGATVELRLNASTLSSPNSLIIPLTSDLIPCSFWVSDLLNGSGSWTQAKVGVLLILSSPLANLLKARTSAGWSSDITMEVLGASLIAVMGSPSMSAVAWLVRAEFQVWQGGMTTQGG